MAQSNSDLSETLDEVAELMDAADEIKKAYISLISRIKEKKDIVCDLYDKMSYALGCLLDPEEGYILLAKQLAGLSTLITDALNLKSEIPKEMVPQIERLKECADNAKQALQKMRDRIEPLLKVWSNIILNITILLVSVEKTYESSTNISHYYSFKIVDSFWLTPIPRRILYNQLMLTILQDERSIPSIRW